MILKGFCTGLVSRWGLHYFASGLSGLFHSLVIFRVGNWVFAFAGRVFWISLKAAADDALPDAATVLLKVVVVDQRKSSSNSSIFNHLS